MSLILQFSLNNKPYYFTHYDNIYSLWPFLSITFPLIIFLDLLVITIYIAYTHISRRLEVSL